MQLFPLFYFGPLDYYSKICQLSSIEFEMHENFTKQTYRNRCTIVSDQGKQNLSIPIIKSASKIPMQDVRLSYTENWQKNHWRAISAAYQNSPFFEFYDYLLYPYFEKEIKYLVDFSLPLHELVIKCLESDTQYSLSSKFEPIESENDNRVLFHAKKESVYISKFQEYKQVFHPAIPFEPNLSVIDLIFNVGPNSGLYLKRLQNKME